MSRAVGCAVDAKPRLASRRPPPARHVGSSGRVTASRWGGGLGLGRRCSVSACRYGGCWRRRRCPARCCSSRRRLWAWVLGFMPDLAGPGRYSCLIWLCGSGNLYAHLCRWPSGFLGGSDVAMGDILAGFFWDWVRKPARARWGRQHVTYCSCSCGCDFSPGSR
jgi:hypothetical protein